MLVRGAPMGLGLRQVKLFWVQESVQICPLQCRGCLIIYRVSDLGQFNTRDSDGLRPDVHSRLCTPNVNDVLWAGAKICIVPNCAVFSMRDSCNRTYRREQWDRHDVSLFPLGSQRVGYDQAQKLPLVRPCLMALGILKI